MLFIIWSQLVTPCMKMVSSLWVSGGRGRGFSSGSACDASWVSMAYRFCVIVGGVGTSRLGLVVLFLFWLLTVCHSLLLWSCVLTSVSSLEVDSRWWLALIHWDCVLDEGLLCFICEGGISYCVLVAGVFPGAVCILLSVRFRVVLW